METHKVPEYFSPFTEIKQSYSPSISENKATDINLQ